MEASGVETLQNAVYRVFASFGLWLLFLSPSRIRMISSILFLLFLSPSPPLLVGQSVVKVDDALIDMLVWGTDLGIDSSAYPPELKTVVKRHLSLAVKYRPIGEVPTASDMRMVNVARVRYERRLAAVSDDPQAPNLAREYVAELRPCYEWEGYHECPEREAIFADEYEKAHPNGPFSPYMPLLAAHRWLCTSEAYVYEKRPMDAELSRRRYETDIVLARRSELLLIRTAAENLSARGKCFASH